MLTPLKTQVRIRIQKMLRADFTPCQVRNALKDCGVRRSEVARLVLQEHKNLLSERCEPPSVDITGLVPLWSDGHYADPRSAEIIFAARKQK